MPELITITDMMRSFSDIVGRVYYKGESFDIKKGANIVARLSPAKGKSKLTISDLNNFFYNSPHLDKSDIDLFSNDIKDLKSLRQTGDVNKWQ